MLKDEALKWRDRLGPAAAVAARKHGVEGLADDGKLYHDEVDGAARWAQRLAPPGWPHAAARAGAPARAGLRFEVWYRPGKGEDELVLWLLCADEPALAGLRDRLAPVLADLLTGGKTAGRYKAPAAVDPLAERLERGVIGLGRTAKAAKAEAALVQLVDDALKPVEAVVAAWREAGGAEAFDAAPVDPLAALRERFGKRD